MTATTRANKKRKNLPSPLYLAPMGPHHYPPALDHYYYHYYHKQQQHQQQQQQQQRTQPSVQSHHHMAHGAVPRPTEIEPPPAPPGVVAPSMGTPLFPPPTHSDALGRIDMNSIFF
ncbi:putative cyclin-dependent serine/threonine-protein kinase DDB_G0272797/DDB_G0274007 [Anopheles cruzii]|uniref:putative cyclin-dependent serine/threonine-protein kinase DDB_G0272797/DDB_G0274007 n=1 Tax=Anopheles cruzii TaxID=68878 RepID=UPI0022EC3AC5|nr:putative cyclin-dependent serine/threonine-protein kinase DDB_G0272797/DDB_G0274007 [Anopheles cruzii]